MLDPLFRPSDKFRDLSRNSALFSSLTIFFSFYKIPMASLPFISVNLDPKVAADVFKKINVAVVLLILAIFYSIQMIITYATEYIDWWRADELMIASKALDNKISDRPSVQLDSDAQRSFRSAQRHLDFIYYCNKILRWLRFAFEFAMPAFFFFLALWREGRNLCTFFSITI